MIVISVGFLLEIWECADRWIWRNVEGWDWWARVWLVV